jgi:small subunit ribosomal protein S19
MNRSKWKGFYIDKNFIKNDETLKKKIVIPTILRKSAIIPKFVGKVFKIHSGKNFSKITVLKNMIGHKFGEFIPTRTKFTFKKKKKKKR